MEYTIYPLKDTTRFDELCALFATGLADTTPEYWKWKHYSENGMPEGTILVAEDENGILAGMFALQPEFFVCGDERLLLVQTEDLVIDPRYRGTGLMKKLYHYAMSYFTECGASGFIAFTNDNSYPVFMKYGATDMGDIYCIHTPKTPMPFYAKKQKAYMDGWSIEICDSMPEDLTFPVNAQAFQMEKNQAFMQWKFEDNPDGPFRWLAIRREGALYGYMVFHVNAGRLRRAVNIYDWMLSEAIPHGVLHKAVRLLGSHGNWVSLFGRYTDEILQQWKKAGLCKTAKQGTHFLLHAFPGKTLPENWHITRVNLDY